MDLLSPTMGALPQLLTRTRDYLATQAPPLSPTVQPRKASATQSSPALTWESLPLGEHLTARALRFLSHDLGLDGTAQEYSGEYSEREANFLLSLGHDFRKYGLSAKHYEPLAHAIRHAADVLKFSEQEQLVMQDATNLSCHLMAMGAQRCPNPATRAAEVLEVEHVFPGHGPRGEDAISIIRLQEAEPIAWWTGQYLDVRTPYGQQSWQYLHPAIPANPDGYIEFHVRGEREHNRAIIAQAQPGDQWVIGSHYGLLNVLEDSQQPVCMIAESTGFAPLRALLLEMAQRATPPRTRLYYGAASLPELYDIRSLLSWARAWDWLQVVPVVSSADVAAGAEAGTGTGTGPSTGPSPDAQDLLQELDGLLRFGHVTNAVLQDTVFQGAAGKNSRILISGPQQMVRGAVAALLEAGVAEEQLCFDKH